MAKADKEPGFFKSYTGILRTLGVIVTLTACVATIGGFYFQIRQANPRIDVILQSNQNLTYLPQIPQLKADFRFDERPVRDLWQSRLTLLNSGRKTIIGEGQQKNIVRDAIVLGVSKGFNLLQLQTESADFSTVVKKIDESHFSISFLQWRRNETINLTVYLERTDRNIPAPSFLSEDRHLIDGDIVFLDASILRSRQPKTLLDHLNPTIAAMFRGCVLAILSGVAALSVWACFMETREYLGAHEWRRRYFGQFKEMVIKEFPTKMDEILAAPFSAPREVWKKFSPEPKTKNTLSEGKTLNYAIFVLVVLLLFLSSLAGMAGLIVL